LVDSIGMVHYHIHSDPTISLSFSVLKKQMIKSSGGRKRDRRIKRATGSLPRLLLSLWRI